MPLNYRRLYLCVYSSCQPKLEPTMLTCKPSIMQHRKVSAVPWWYTLVATPKLAGNIEVYMHASSQ